MYKQITSNKRKSLALLFGFLLLYALLGWLLSLWFGSWVFGVVIVIAIVMIVVNLFLGDDLVLRVSGAHQIHRKEDAPALWRTIENLAITAGLPMPRVYVIEDDAPNAFAAGRTRALRADREGRSGRIPRHLRGSETRDQHRRYRLRRGVVPAPGAHQHGRRGAHRHVAARSHRALRRPRRLRVHHE